MQTKRSFANQVNLRDDAATGIGDPLASQTFVDTTDEHSRSYQQANTNDDLNYLQQASVDDEEAVAEALEAVGPRE